MPRNPKIALIRGAFLNPWEMQNYEPLVKRFNLTAFSSLKPLNKRVKLPLVKLPSPMDLPQFPYKMQTLNRTLIDAHWLFGLEQRLKGFDIAHVAETYYAYTHQTLEAKKKGLVKKVVSTCWEIIPHNNETIWGRRSWKEQALREIDHFICPTILAKQCLIKEGCRSEKISVVRMGVNLDKLKAQSSKRKATIKNSKLNILFIGRLEEEKGVWELLQAFCNLRKRYKNLQLTMIGSGSQGEKISDFIKKSSMIRIIELKKIVDYEKMGREYEKADVFVLPSKPTKNWQEQYGMVLVEAMATGLPIVASKTGAIPEVLEKAGILVKPESVIQLTKALFQMIKSERKRIKLGIEARKRAEKLFDHRKTAKKIERIYFSLF